MLHSLLAPCLSAFLGSGTVVLSTPRHQLTQTAATTNVMQCTMTLTIPWKHSHATLPGSWGGGERRGSTPHASHSERVRHSVAASVLAGGAGTHEVGRHWSLRILVINVDSATVVRLHCVGIDYGVLLDMHAQQSNSAVAASRWHG